MSERLVWICDGCDAEMVRNKSRDTDWKSVSVQLSGFAGYPTNATEPSAPSSYHLCPSCARHYYINANPRNWVRESPVDTTSPPAQNQE